MALSLREILDRKCNVPTAELIDDESLKQQYLYAARYYVRFKLWPRAEYTFSITDGEYKFEFDVDKIISVTDSQGNSVNYTFDNYVLKVFNGSGTYVVKVALSINSAYINDLPFALENLFYYSCKLAIGERLSFAKYTDMPFEINASEWKNDGKEGVDKWERFIQVNRDEDPDNISDLKNESYSGLRFYTILGTQDNTIFF